MPDSHNLQLSFSENPGSGVLNFNIEVYSNRQIFFSKLVIGKLSFVVLFCEKTQGLSQRILKCFLLDPKYKARIWRPLDGDSEEGVTREGSDKFLFRVFSLLNFWPSSIIFPGQRIFHILEIQLLVNAIWKTDNLPL